MSDLLCPLSARVSSYLDGELAAEAFASFERHVATCAACQAQLQAFGRLSAALAKVQTPSLSPLALARMQRDPRLHLEWRAAAHFASGLVGVAASVLLVGAAMLYGRMPSVPEQTVMNMPEAWEGAAIALAADDSAQMGDRSMAEWFVSDLSRPRPHR